MTNVDMFIEKARRYTIISELTPELLRMFINKIVVHEKSEKCSRTAEQKVGIHYAHIGVMENADSLANTEMGADGMTPSAPIPTRNISYI